MRYSWLHTSGKNKLMVFCNGWGMDEKPFQHLQSHQYDILMLHDYRDLHLSSEIQTKISAYPEKFLVGWSMGVWAGQNIFAGISGCFSATVAINGTLCPIDDDRGIPRQVFAGTRDNWGEAARLKFYRRLFTNSLLLSKFLVQQPSRTFTDQQQELTCLFKVAKNISLSSSIYRKKIICLHDRIFPSNNQREHWQEEGVTYLDDSHFPFFSFNSWDSIIAEPAE